MIICWKCEHENVDGSVFCQQCGSRLTHSMNTEVKTPSGSQGMVKEQQNMFPPVNKKRHPSFSNALDPLENERPLLFTVFLILNYAVAGILALFSLLFYSTPLFFLVVLSIAGLFCWLTFSLQHYSETSRNTYLVLVIIGMIFFLLGFNAIEFKVLIMGISVFGIYVLLLHQPTFVLFKNTSKISTYKNTRGAIKLKDIDGHELAYYEQNAMQGYKGG